MRDVDQGASRAAADVRDLHPGPKPQETANRFVVSSLGGAQILAGPSRGEVERRTPSKLVEDCDETVEPADQPGLFADPDSVVLWKFADILEATEVGQSPVQVFAPYAVLVLLQ